MNAYVFIYILFIATRFFYFRTQIALQMVIVTIDLALLTWSEVLPP